MAKKTCQPRVPYLAKLLYIDKSEIKPFVDKVVCKSLPLLKKLLKAVVQQNGHWTRKKEWKEKRNGEVAGQGFSRVETIWNRSIRNQPPAN